MSWLLVFQYLQIFHSNLGINPAYLLMKLRGMYLSTGELIYLVMYLYISTSECCPKPISTWQSTTLATDMAQQSACSLLGHHTVQTEY